MENNILTSGNETHDLSNVLIDVLARLDNLEKKENESSHSKQQRGQLAFKETSL